MDVMARLRYSPRARQKSSRRRAFFPAARLCYQVPVAGYLLNAAAGLARPAELNSPSAAVRSHVLAQTGNRSPSCESTQRAQVLATEAPAALFRLQQAAAVIAEQQSRQLTEIAQQQAELAALHREQLQDLQSFNDEKRQQVDSLIHGQQQLEALVHEHRQYLEQRVESLAGQPQRQLATFITEQQAELAKTHAQLEHFQTLIDNQREVGS